MATYSWLTQTQAISALQGRLSNTAFWSSAELWLYISEGLRHWNGLTEDWNADVVIPNASGQWINTGTLAGSPRKRTQTDQNLYAQMLYMLLEGQLTGGVTWTGTSQFNLSLLQNALQYRVQEVIQATACNLGQLAPIASAPGSRRILLGDTVLQPRRIRFLGVQTNTTASASSGATSLALASGVGVAQGQIVTGNHIPAGTFVSAILGNTANISLPTTGVLSATAVQFSQPTTLTREDTQAFQYFEPGSFQQTGTPQSWAMASEPPLAFDVDIAPSQIGSYDVLALNSASDFNPPAAGLLGIPDDWSLVPMYGALADVLGSEPEATDRQRSDYCMNRYEQGIKMILASNWLLQLNLNGIVADPTPLAQMDQYATGWQESANNLPAVIQAGIDLVAPVPASGQSMSMTVVGNAPLLDGTNTYVQCSRDDWPSVLDYAHVTAAFKLGGETFATAMPLLKGFYRAAADANKRWLTYGVMVDILKNQGKRQMEAEPR